MKSFIQLILQSVFGYRNYLFIFSLFTSFRLKWDKKEKDFFKFLELIDNSTGLILDIGANIGIMTKHLSKHFKQASVLAFEPIPSNVSTLKRIIQFYRLENVEIKELALSDKNGEAEMILPVLKGVKKQGLSHMNVHENEKGIKFKVKTKRLDDIDEVKQIKVLAIKLDVENHEFFVLQGARQILKRDKPVIYSELWENENRQKCFLFLRELGYKVYCCHQKELLLYNEQKHHTQNFIFLTMHTER
ncbi:FkbM family methyltransferase [Bacteroidota bacterium]